jgi:hypothetical protein
VRTASERRRPHCGHRRSDDGSLLASYAADELKVLVDETEDMLKEYLPE